MAFDMGSAFGGFVDAAVTAINAEQERDEARRARRERARAVEQGRQTAMHDFDTLQSKLDEYNKGRIRLADQGTVDELKSLMSNYEPETYDFDKFSYTKSVDDFINPEADKIAELAGLKTQSQLAGQGAAKGTGGLAGIGYSRWEAANQLYKDAQQAMRDDRTQAYTEYGDYIDRMQKKLDTINQGKLNKINLLSGAVTNEQTAESDYMADLMSLMSDRAKTNLEAGIGAYA